MAKSKTLTVTFQGRQIARRTTHLEFACVVARVEFDRTGYMSAKQQFLDSPVAARQRVQNAEYLLALAACRDGAPHPCGMGTFGEAADHDRQAAARASIERAGGASVEALVLLGRREEEQHWNRYADELQAQGPVVISWHRTQAQGFKELGCYDSARWGTYRLLFVDPATAAA